MLCSDKFQLFASSIVGLGDGDGVTDAAGDMDGTGEGDGDI